MRSFHLSRGGSRPHQLDSWRAAHNRTARTDGRWRVRFVGRPPKLAEAPGTCDHEIARRAASKL
jgi:hypothetical protein